MSGGGAGKGRDPQELSPTHPTTHTVTNMHTCTHAHIVVRASSPCPTLPSGTQSQVWAHSQSRETVPSVQLCCRCNALSTCNAAQADLNNEKMTFYWGEPRTRTPSAGAVERSADYRNMNRLGRGYTASPIVAQHLGCRSGPAFEAPPMLASQGSDGRGHAHHTKKSPFTHLLPAQQRSLSQPNSEEERNGITTVKREEGEGASAKTHSPVACSRSALPLTCP